MKKLSITPRRWLLSLHILFSVAFLGPILGYIAMMSVGASKADGQLLAAAYSMISVLDVHVVRPGAVGTALTGVLLSLLTSWGLFRHWWIIAKLALNVGAIALGAAWLGNLLTQTAALSASLGAGAMQNAAFLAARHQLWIGIWIQLGLLTAAFVISVFKPWGRRAGAA